MRYDFISWKFILQILLLNIKKLLNICHANCSQIAPSFAIPSKFETSWTSNSRKSNEVSLKFCICKVFVIHDDKASVFFLLQKKFFHTIFVEYFFLSTWVYNFRIKMFHQNGGQNFVLYYLIFTWVKFHVKITRFKLLGAPYSNECFPKTYLKLVF